MRLAGNNGLTTCFQSFLSIKKNLIGFGSPYLYWQMQMDEYVVVQTWVWVYLSSTSDFFTDILTAWGKSLPQAGNNPLVYGQQ